MSILHQYLCRDTTNEQEITSINLGANNLTGASSHLIADIISHLQPHTLDLRRNYITNVRDIFTAVIATSKVKVLNMFHSGLTAQEAPAIRDMMICLEDLKIASNELDDHGAPLLSEGIKNTKTLKVLDISHNNIGPSGTTTIANALSSNTSLEELYMYDHNFVEQDAAKALGIAIVNNKKLKKFALSQFYNKERISDYDLAVFPMDKESAMIIIRSLYNNNTITELCIDITLCESDITLITREAERVNSVRQSHNEHIIDFMLQFTESEPTPYGKYTTEGKLSWESELQL